MRNLSDNDIGSYDGETKAVAIELVLETVFTEKRKIKKKTHKSEFGEDEEGHLL